MENIGKKIKQYRKSADLTQKQLAQKCGYATGTIQQYELGKRSPRLPLHDGHKSVRHEFQALIQQC